MFIRLLSKDIPRYWDAIKQAMKQVDEVDARQFPAYAREMLIALMSDKAQAWLRISAEREIVLICLTRILHNHQFDEDYLYIQGVYSWKREPEEVWQQNLDVLKEFARKEGCAYVGCMSRNPRIWEVVRQIGFQESTRIFALRLT